MSAADEMLKNLETERNLCEMRQCFPLKHDVFEEEDRKDIMEHWTENTLDEWRGIKKIYIFIYILLNTEIKMFFAVQHRQREKEYHQKLAKLKEKEKTDIRTEEDLFKRLDELEIEEELEDEIYRLQFSFTQLKLTFDDSRNLFTVLRLQIGSRTKRVLW